MAILFFFILLHCWRNSMQRRVLIRAPLSNNKHEPVTELGSNLELVDLWLLSSVFKCVYMSKCVLLSGTCHPTVAN